MLYSFGSPGINRNSFKQRIFEKKLNGRREPSAPHLNGECLNFFCLCRQAPIKILGKPKGVVDKLRNLGFKVT